MKRLALIAGAIVLVLLAAAAIMPFLVPGEVYRAQIEKSASQALGREVTLTGDAGLSLLPRLSARVDGVTVANPDGFSRPNMVEAGELRGVVKWAPLLARRVEIAELVFVDADVKLERLESGETNWTFGSGEPAGDAQEGGTGGGLQAGIDRASLQNARLVYEDAQAGLAYELSELDLTARLPALDGELVTDASGVFQGSDFDLDLTLDSVQAILDGAQAQMDITLDIGEAALSYDGAIALGEAPQLSGGFSLDARDLSALATLAGIEPGINLGALGRLRAAGQVDGPLDTAAVTFETLSVAGNGLDASYAGRLTLGEAIALAGTLSAQSGDLSDWLGGLDIDLPQATGILDRIDIETRLDGPVDALRLSELQATHQGDQLDARFDGEIALGGNGRIAGEVQAASAQLRPLLDNLGIELAPGETLETFSIESELDGSFEQLRFADLTGQLDDAQLTGSGALNLAGERPEFTGNFVAGTLDLSPFLGASGDGTQADAPQGWSDEPLDLAGLSAADADISLRADRIILGDITLTSPDLTAKLAGGALTANIARLQTLGGQWTGQFGLDASGAIPRMRIDMAGEMIQLSETLQTLAGLGAMSGLGELSIDVRSEGRSIQALVEGLSGEMATNIADGQVRGINVGQLVRSRENVMQALASGELQMALAPEAETDFTSLLAGLSIDGGVASLDSFRMVNPVLSLEGSGKINLAAQTLDVSIVPRLDASGQAGGSSLQLNNVPIPFRISGNWLSPGLSPDMDLLARIVQQDAAARIREEVSDQIGGDVGGLLGEMLGTGGSDAAPAPPETPADTETPETEAPAPAEPEPRDTDDVVRDAARDAARDALGDLFGRRSEPEPEPEPQPDE